MADRAALDAQRAERILAQIAERRFERLTLSVVAREIGMSTSTAQRALRSQGLDFRRAVALVRLEHAGYLLARDPGIKIEAVAREVGWKSRTSLYLAIRHHFVGGMAEWREFAGRSQNS